MAVKLTDVASEAGVSLATASRVLNGSERKPAEEIAQRVRAAADKLGYFPNAQAQALARSTTKLIGLLVHDIADPYFSSIAKGVQRGLGDTGVQLLLSSTGSDAGRELSALRSFMSHRTGAVILAGSRPVSGDEEMEAALEGYKANGGAVAMIGQPLPVAGGVQIDNYGSAALLATELLKLGHRHFVILAGDQGLVTARHRAQGLVEKLKKSGVEPLVIKEGAFTREGGYLAMSDLLLGGALPEGQQVCVICVSDVMALGALVALREHGISVPQQVAIAGFDDIPTLADVVPSLTTVRLPLEEIGKMAGQMVLGGGNSRRMVIEGIPVIRESTQLHSAG